MNEESEVKDTTQRYKTQTFMNKTRRKKRLQNASKVDKSGKPIKSGTKDAFGSSQRQVGKGNTQRAEREANHSKKKDGVNPFKKNVDVTRSTEMTFQSDLYVDMNQTSCYQSQTEKYSAKRKTNGQKLKNKLRSFVDKSPRNNQQNYENIDLKNTDSKVKVTEHESVESDYANISSSPSVSTDSNSTDSSSSPDELHGNTIIYKAKKVNIIKMYSINDEK
ncbi:uncharacterized protein LOC134697199 [Mytilus trossulus]|uniref:uncharacterized protein LOC134697199 n=1 Tax=Mytilus trossulus TaxID=6551 RepID=UPI0030049FDC